MNQNSNAVDLYIQKGDWCKFTEKVAEMCRNANNNCKSFWNDSGRNEQFPEMELYHCSPSLWICMTLKLFKVN